MAIVNLSYTTPGSTTITLPSGVRELTYTINGAGGGGGGTDAGSPGGNGGRGATVSGTATGLNGGTLVVYVGGGGGGGGSGGGAAGGSAGTNGGSLGGGGGGGNSGPSPFSGSGGGGGSGSYIQVDSNVIAVAGGGGGGGGGGNDGGYNSFQTGGNGGTTLTTTQSLSGGSAGTNHPGDGGGGGGGGGGNPGGSGGASGSGDADGRGGSGGGSYYNPTYHTVAPTASSNGGSGAGSSSAGSSGSVTISYDDEDGQPDPVSAFTSIFDAALSTTYTTTTSVTVSGINVSVPASASNGAIIIKNGVNTGSSTTTVVNGDTLALTMMSSPNYSTMVDSTLTFGLAGESVTATWQITTTNIPPNVPNPFSFTDLTNQPLSSEISSNTVTISGLVRTANVIGSAITSGTSTPMNILINGVDIGNTGTIDNGDTLQLKVISAGTANTTTTAQVQVGTGSPVFWDVTTVLSVDTGPDPFNFIDVTGAVAADLVSSNVVTIVGINSPSQIAVTDPTFEVNVNGSGWVNPTTTPTTISNNQTLQVRGFSSATIGAVVTVTVTIGGGSTGSASDVWNITTGTPPDTTPNAFNFVDRLNQTAAVDVESNTVVPSGFDTPTNISVNVVTSGGTISHQVSFDNGVTWNLVPYTSSSFFPGTSIKLKLTTGAYGSASGTVRVTIGGVSDDWTVSVLTAPPTGSGQGKWYSKPVNKLDGYALGTVITVFKDSSGNFGTLDGSMSSRYPGFIECDGRTLNAADYPDLFNAIGTTYGGTASRTLTADGFVYSGTFDIPDFRNRRVFGTGVVNGNQPSSPAVPTRIGPSGTGTGSVNEPGSIGGDWYIATVDAAGSLPLEQIEGTPPASGGTTGQFYALGTVRTTGYSNIGANVSFNVAGNMKAAVGPLIETLVSTPGHQHSAGTGQVSNSANGLLSWGTRGMKWGAADNFWRRSSNDWSNSIPFGPSIPPGTGYNQTFTYSNFWPSLRSNNLQLNNTDNGTGRVYLGAIDVFQSTGGVDVYSPSGGGTLQHNHALSLNPFGPIENTYSYGNSNGIGTVTSGMPSNATVDVVFSHTQTGIRSNTGRFQLDSSKALIPSVSIRPDRTIPLIQPYFVAKYLIKAF